MRKSSNRFAILYGIAVLILWRAGLRAGHSETGINYRIADKYQPACLAV